MTTPRKKPIVMLLFGWSDPEGFEAVSNYAREHDEFIKTNLCRPLSLDQIADASGISRRTLYHLFRDDLGMTPPEHLRRQRTQLADRLLREQPGMTRREAARQAGFTCTRTLTRSLGNG